MSRDDPTPTPSDTTATAPAAHPPGRGAWFLLVLLAATVLGGAALVWGLRANVTSTVTSTGTIEITPVGGPLTEEQKIDLLIADIAALKGAAFIRNNTEHTAVEAAAHLRRKRSSAGGDITTARQFIEQVATKSSLSGEPYRIRLGDGRVVPAGEYLTKRLGEIEAHRR